MSFFYDLNKKLDSIRATPEVTHQQLNERDMSRAAKGYEKYGREGMEALAKAGREGKALDPVRKKYDKYDNNDKVNEMYGPYDDDKVDAINAANPPKTSGTGMKPATPVKHHTYDRKAVASNISGEESAKYDYRGQVEEGPMDAVKKIGKKVAGGINRLVGHGSDEDMRRDVQRKAGVPQTGKKPDQKTTEAAKYRDPKYKDKLYTQEPPDYTYGPDMDDAYDNPKPDDYAGRKRKIGGGEFPSTDPLASGLGIGRSGIKNNILDRGSRKGMPSRNQISSLKGSIKSARGTHAEPNLPEAGAPMTQSNKGVSESDLGHNVVRYYEKTQDVKKLSNWLEKNAGLPRNSPLYFDDVDLVYGNKTIVPGALINPKLTFNDLLTAVVQASKQGMAEEDGAPMSDKQKSFAKLAPPANKITFADKIAGAKKEVDEMLGDVAAEAMRSALGGGKGRNAEMDEERSKGTAFDMSTRKVDTPKVGSVERGSKHDIKHTATGRMVTRRTDAQGNSVGADDDSDTQAGPRGRGRPKGTTGAIGAKGPSGKSKLMTREGDQDIEDQGEYDQEGDMAKDDIKTIVRHAQALSKVLGDNDNLPEWVQSKLAKIEGMMISIDEYMQNQESDEEEPIAEKAVSKQQQKFMGMAHAMQKGEKVKGASKELKKVASTMKPKDTEDFAKTKHKGLPDKAKSKKKEEDVEESTTAGSVATSTATKGGGGMVGKGIYDSMNRELENMIAESMTINMSDSTEGGKSLTITATDEDALKLGMLLKNAGLGSGDAHGGDMHSSGEQPCATCGMPDCGCGDVQEAVDENSPDYPTNTEQADNNFGYAGGLNKPKTDVAGDGQTTVPNSAVHTQDEDALRRMMEMAGLAEGKKECPPMSHIKKMCQDGKSVAEICKMHPDCDQTELKQMVADCTNKMDEGKMPMTKVNGKSVPAFAADGKGKNDLEAKDKEEDTVEESIRRMMEIAGVKKKPMDEEKTDEGNKFAFNVLKAKEAGKKEADLDGDGDMEKVRESIFALDNQWRAYKG